MRRSVIQPLAISLCYLIVLSSANSSFANDELSESEFRKLHSEIVPATPAWKSIPWYADLISAQRAAIKQSKPIFIWSMDGHPLGCT